MGALSCWSKEVAMGIQPRSQLRNGVRESKVTDSTVPSFCLAVDQFGRFIKTIGRLVLEVASTSLCHQIEKEISKVIQNTVGSATLSRPKLAGPFAP